MKRLCLIALVIVLLTVLIFINCTPVSTPPRAPTGLTCNAVSSSQIDLSWSASRGADGYNVYRCTGTSCTPTESVHTGSITSWSDTGLSPDTTYCYRVKAYNEYGESDYSKTTVCTTPAPPSAPTDLTCNAFSSSRIDLSWSASSGATGYKVYRCTGTSCTPTELVHTGASTSWSDTGLTPSTTYCYRVTAYNGAGESDYSATVSCTTYDYGVSWVARYNGPGDLGDYAYAMTVDGSANIYVTGASHSWDAGSGTYRYDYATIKYDPNGNELWVRRYDGPGNEDDSAKDIAVDASDNVYVTGSSTGDGTYKDYTTIKYDSNGNELWVRRYDGPGHYDDWAQAIAIDGSGNVYVTGYSCADEPMWTLYHPPYDWATIKYDSNGNELWVRRYGCPSGWCEDYHCDDYAYAIAIDSYDNVVVTGGVLRWDPYNAWTESEYTTIKYSSNGEIVWVATSEFEGTACAIAINDGSIYVTGYGWGDGLWDYFTVKYSSSGVAQWTKTYDGPASLYDFPQAIAVDDVGNVYVTGKSKELEAGNERWDYATIKYGPDGDELWCQRYNGPGNHDDEARAIAVDGSGNVYVTGYSRGSGTGPDYATIKYDPNGATLWEKRYNGQGGPHVGSDYAYDIVVDGSGNIYVTGYSYDSYGWLYVDYATIKYSE